MLAEHLPTRFLSCFLTAGALTLTGCATLENPGVRPLNQSEVRSLFEKHTVTSRNLSTGTVSVSYYSKRKVSQIRNGDKRTGRWRVKRNGLHCLTMELNEEVCRYVRLDADGVYRKYPSPALWEKPIIEYVKIEPGKNLPQSGKLRKVDIAEMQRMLTRSGYNTGPADGVWGPRSREAMNRYQRDQGLPVTGEPTRSMERRLSGQ